MIVKERESTFYCGKPISEYQNEGVKISAVRIVSKGPQVLEDWEVTLQREKNSYLSRFWSPPNLRMI